METLETYTTRLNALLDENDLSQSRFEIMIKEIIEKFNPKFSLLDFAYYNEELLEKSGNEKMEALEKGNYELAAEKRNIEKECMEHIDLKMDLEIEKSMFCCKGNYLHYFSLGLTENDRLVNELYAKLSQGNNTFIKISSL